MDCEPILLGTGNAGTAAADPRAQAGWKVALVGSWDVGGTCALRGCAPKKGLVAAAEALDASDRAPAHGIEVGKPPGRDDRVTPEPVRATYGR